MSHHYPTEEETANNPHFITSPQPQCKACHVHFWCVGMYLIHFTTSLGQDCFSGTQCPQCGVNHSSTEKLQKHLREDHKGWWPRIIDTFGEKRWAEIEEEKAGSQFIWYIIWLVSKTYIVNENSHFRHSHITIVNETPDTNSQLVLSPCPMQWFHIDRHRHTALHKVLQRIYQIELLGSERQHFPSSPILL